MTMAKTAWEKIKLTGDPILVVGLRPATKVQSFRLVLDKSLHPEILAVAQNALAETAGRTAIPYTPYVDVADDEYLALAPSALTTTRTVASRKAGAPPTQKQRTAALWEALQKADSLPTIGARQLLARAEELYYQAICFHDANGVIIAFVTKTNARQVLKRSLIPLGIDNAKDRFKKIDRPAIVLESDIHAILETGEIAILNRTQFQFIVGDISLVSQYAQAQVALITTALKRHGIPFEAATGRALEAKAADSVAVAKRLDAFYERVAQIDVTLVRNGKGFRDQNLERTDFVNPKGELSCKPERIIELLDALEGRYFGDSFSEEERRADRFRPR